MARTGALKPDHAAVKQYYATLQSYSDQRVEHEGATETAFQQLLANVAKSKGWTLIPKLKLLAGGKTLYPDGTLRDQFNLPRGYWEAKDTNDDLNVEIRKKIEKGYPRDNIIYEDTRQAVLIQGGQEQQRYDLTKPQELVNLLHDFFAYTEPDIEGFERAVQEFKEQVPNLAKGLNEKLKAAHKNDPDFQKAFDGFFTLCQETLNPNISRDAVDEMFVQHLLTERLIRKVFDNPEFTRRNVIAAEVEKVIEALVSHSFNRDDFLKSLDRFYRAIEEAARHLEDFADKQHFLNTVYERFFQGYSVKTADTHGIVYTPQPIVDFMCASVEEVLKTEFNLSLGSPGVNILDPCTGTGNFIVNLLRRIPKRDLPRVYREQLFANEVMLLPYYIAALNIEHAYFELTGNYEAFEGLCFVDTLELAEQKGLLSFMNEKNAERVKRQKDTPITVIIGNPPYNANQQNESDNNKNRTYPTIDARIRMTYAKDSKAGLKNKLYDPYIKFIRWAQDRLESRDGIICLITNNNFFVDKYPFDGLRKHFGKEFATIYHLDLHGNARRDRKLSGTTHNVFGIPIGVGITILVKSAIQTQHKTNCFRVSEVWCKEEKLHWLEEHKTSKNIPWNEVIPDMDHSWLSIGQMSEYYSLMALGDKETKRNTHGNHHTLFKIYSLGVKTNRDEFVYSFSRNQLLQRMDDFIDAYNEEVDRLKRAKPPIDIDQFVRHGRVKWDGTLKEQLQRFCYGSHDEAFIRHSFYRPFTKQFLYFDSLCINRVYLQKRIFPTLVAEEENAVICCTNHSQMPFAVQISHWIPNEAVGGRAGQCFPFYVYDEDGSNRRENITDWALKQFRSHYKSRKLSKWDIFYYVYGLMHHPGYRTKFADNLKRELPRIPFAPDFKAFATAGEHLARLHLDYETLEPHPLQFVETPDLPLSYKVEDKMRLAKDKTSLRVNPSLTLAGIPPEVFQYRLGNRSALDWVIDQYQVSEDKRSGIRSDPNRPDDPEYIVRLVGQVIHVSLETVRIVGNLPAAYHRSEVAPPPVSVYHGGRGHD
jgi:predicted helicase